MDESRGNKYARICMFACVDINTGRTKKINKKMVTNSGQEGTSQMGIEIEVRLLKIRLFVMFRSV